MIFKKGLKCEVHNPIFPNYMKGTIVTLKKKFTDGDIDEVPYWSVKEGESGVAEREMCPCVIKNWRGIIENDSS